MILCRALSYEENTLDKNHAATILRWAADDTAKAAPKQGIPDYTYKEGESL